MTIYTYNEVMMYIDKIEIFPVECRADIIYIKGEDDEWPKGQAKYKKLLSDILGYDIKHWTFGTYKTVEQSVMVEW